MTSGAVPGSNSLEKKKKNAFRRGTRGQKSTERILLGGKNGMDG